MKLRPDELIGGPVKSDWLLWWRLRPRGLPNPVDGPEGRKKTQCLPLVNTPLKALYVRISHVLIAFFIADV